MSDSYVEKVICPECGREGEFTYWRTINTYTEPVMSKMVRTGEAFMYTCPECGKTTIIDFPFIYHQMEDHMMIYYAKEDDKENAVSFFENQDKKFEELKVGGEMYLNRVVTSLDQFLEKLKIFDAGLDDRAVEMVKLLVTGLVEQQNPDFKADEVLFTFGPAGNKMLSFMKDGSVAFSVELPEQLYNSVWEKYSGRWSALRASGPIIDKKWALSQEI